MYIPIFIAILLGLLSPSNNTSANKKGSIYINTNEPPKYSTFDTDSTSTEIEDGTGGENGQLPPPKPKP
ncbi:hypothetical protein [Pedobacter nanyangensis]|uniref:hypothetical protein n=1 Tax=Pedobacter nanyangensis TaxID=1562389 RepID=UPI000DE46FB9|nr:hypothetical protein [Pedobacter nanyangensis]